MSTPNKVYETMTKLKCCGFDVRVWREEPNLNDGVNLSHYEMAEAGQLFASRGGVMLPRSEREVAEYFASLPRVSAVEVTRNGDGVLIYPDWK